MSKTRENIVNFLKGEFLLREEGFKNWRMLIFIIVLLMLMIRSGHKTDEKVLKIASLSKQERELRAEYIAVRSRAMQLKLESNVAEKVKEMGLKPAEIPAQVIKEIVH
jgi:hypothetical protein